METSNNARTVWPELLIEHLWNGTDDDLRVWALLDGQWATDLVERLTTSGLEFCNLFEGPLTPSRLYNSPYLVSLERENIFTSWLLRDGWGKGWGVYFQASSKLAAGFYPEPPLAHIAKRRSKGEFYGSPGLEHGEDLTALLLRKHFRRFTRVQFEDDRRIVVFRFFDPAVLKTYLISCNPTELETFFGPVRFFIAENFCEIESLNRPNEMLMFSKTKVDAERSGKATVLRQHSLDLNTLEIKAIPVPTETFHSPADPPAAKAAYTLIRTEQMEVFQREQLELFTEEVAQTLLERPHDGKPMSIDSARAVAAEHVPRGRNLGLTSRGDIANFVTCALLFGQGFPAECKTSREVFGRANQTPDTGLSGKSLSDWLAHWAARGSIDCD